MHTLVQLACLLILITAQNISYDSMFCRNFIKMETPEPLKLKYKTMIENLNNDNNLRAQKKRALRFIKNNWKELWGFDFKYLNKEKKSNAIIQLESRSRMVDYLEGLLIAMKPHLTANEHEEIATLLWETDKINKNDVRAYYWNWKFAAVEKISTEKKSLIFDVIDKWEENEENGKFNDDQSPWAPAAGYSGCF